MIGCVRVMEWLGHRSSVLSMARWHSSLSSSLDWLGASSARRLRVLRVPCPARMRWCGGWSSGVPWGVWSRVFCETGQYAWLRVAAIFGLGSDWMATHSVFLGARGFGKGDPYIHVSFHSRFLCQSVGERCVMSCHTVVTRLCHVFSSSTRGGSGCVGGLRKPTAGVGWWVTGLWDGSRQRWRVCRNEERRG